MRGKIMLGWGRWLAPLPAAFWRRRVAGRERLLARHLGFMSEEHHRVRNLAVREIANTGRPLAAATIAEKLGLGLERVTAILDQLQAAMTFLHQEPAGQVLWAYPVTAAPTPHQVELADGRSFHAA